MFSAALAALSCGVMAALIVARIAHQEYDRRLPELSIRLTFDMLAYAKGEAPAPSLDIRGRQYADLVMQTALDVAHALEGEALQRLRSLLRGASLDAYYRRAATHGRIPLRVAAIEFLRMFPDAETARVLAGLTHAPAFRICIAALRTLVEIGDLPSLESVLRLTGRAEGGRSLSLFRIVEACVRADLPVALNHLKADLPSRTRIMLLKALGAAGAWAAFRDVGEAALDPDPEVRAAALTALRAMAAPAAVPIFVAATRDPDWQVRLKAVEGIGQLGKPADRPSIEPLLDDSVWWIRFRAAEAMQRLEPLPASLPSPARAKKKPRKPGNGR
jgi:HEAT repeat protein